jgi:cyclohexanone monooxygenase
MGLAMAGFPNLFMITGPQSPSVKTQMILAGQQHTDWIAEFLEYMRLNGFTRFNVEQQAEDAWVLHNNDIADSTLYPLANSWYVGANVPGKPRVFMPYVGGFDRYKRACDELAQNGYPGLQLSSLGQTVNAAD